MTQNAAARSLLASSDTRRKRLPYVGNAVVSRQALVHERVVGAKQIEDAAVFLTMLSNNSSVSRRNAWRRLSSKSGNCRASDSPRQGSADTATGRRSSSSASPADRPASSTCRCSVAG